MSAVKVDFLPGDIVRIEAWDVMNHIYACIEGGEHLMTLDDDIVVTALSLGCIHDDSLSSFHPEPTDRTPNWQVFIVLSWDDRGVVPRSWLKRGMFLVTNTNDFAYAAATKVDLS